MAVSYSLYAVLSLLLRMVIVSMDTYRHLPAHSVILDVHVLELCALAALITRVTPAPVLIHGTIRAPGLVVVGAHMTTDVLFIGTSLDAHTPRITEFIYLTDTASTAVYLCAGI